MRHMKKLVGLTLAFVLFATAFMTNTTIGLAAPGQNNFKQPMNDENSAEAAVEYINNTPMVNIEISLTGKNKRATIDEEALIRLKNRVLAGNIVKLKINKNIRLPEDSEKLFLGINGDVNNDGKIDHRAQIILDPMLDVSNVKDMEGMFARTQEISDISRWNVSNVEDMSAMFMETRANPNVSKWNVGNVKNMSGMFFRANSANPNVRNWNVAKVESMDSMFYGTAKANPDVSKWNVGKVENMTAMFGSTQVANPDVKNWDVRNVESVAHMFAVSQKANPDLSRWKLNNVESLVNMFSEAKAVERVDLRGVNSEDIDDISDIIGFVEQNPKLRYLAFKNFPEFRFGGLGYEYEVKKTDAVGKEKLLGPFQAGDFFKFDAGYSFEIKALENQVIFHKNLDSKMQGHDIYAKIDVLKGQAIGRAKMPADPKDGDYKFLGWATSPNAEAPNFNFDTIVNSNVEVFGLWHKKDIGVMGSYSVSNGNQSRLALPKGFKYASSFTWRSDNTKVARVKNAVISAGYPGLANIKAITKNKIYKYRVIVKPKMLKNFKGKKHNANLRLSWRPAVGMDGVKIYRAVKSGGKYKFKLYKTLKGAYKNTFTTKLARRNSYGFRAYSYKVIKGKLYYGNMTRTLYFSR